MRGRKPIAAVDARALVPVSDDAGGVVVYVAGRAAYYVMNGEWFAALPEPGDSVPAEGAAGVTTVTRESEQTAVEVDRPVSTP